MTEDLNKHQLIDIIDKYIDCERVKTELAYVRKNGYGQEKVVRACCNEYLHENHATWGHAGYSGVSCEGRTTYSLHNATGCHAVTIDSNLLNEAYNIVAQKKGI